MATTTDSNGASTRTHGITAGVGALSSTLSEVGSTPAWSMTADEQRTALVELAALQSRVAELRLRVLAAADTNEVGLVDGSSSTAAWVAHSTRQVRPQAHADLRLAQHLDGEYDATRHALAAGVVNLAQARAVVAAVEALTDRVPAEDRRRAEAYLLEQARLFDAKGLRIQGKHLFEVLDPETAEQRIGEELEAEERRAREKTRFSMRDNGDGTYSGTFKIPALHAAMLSKGLASLTAPSHTGLEGRRDPDGNKIAHPVLLGRAFCELIERLPAEKLPTVGGLSATVLVKIPLQNLLSGLGAATLDTGTPVSAAEARRLACEAGVIPAVLGGRSEVLDLGRERREFSRAQRLAILVNHDSCAADVCDRAAYVTHAHHFRPWARGGRTDLDKAVPLCPWHHGLAHDSAYAMDLLPDGGVRFHRRT